MIISLKSINKVNPVKFNLCNNIKNSTIKSVEQVFFFTIQ